MQVSRRIVLHFPASLTGQPIVYRLARDYGLEFNIIKASVSPEEEGLMVLEVRGDEQGVEAGMKYLSEKGVMIEPFSQRVVLREERCIHCGLCVGSVRWGPSGWNPTPITSASKRRGAWPAGYASRLVPLELWR